MSASWLEDELPESWPTQAASKSPVKATDEQILDLPSTVTDHMDATVAIQHVNRGVPQWKQRLSPRRSQEGNIENLRSMFPDENGGDSVTTSSMSNASSSVPDYAMSRKLKLFGDRDTYTEQRYDNLLTSLQGHADGTVSTNVGSQRSETVTNTFANRSRGDVAARFLKNGEDVLSRIRKASMLNLKQKKDESLDDLERKLANGTIDTTDDGAQNSNGSTLSSLSSTDWVADEATPVESAPNTARHLTDKFVEEYSRRSGQIEPQLTDQFGSMKMSGQGSQRVPTLSSLSTVDGGKSRSATSSTVLHHQFPSATSTFVPTVQFAPSPKQGVDVSTLAIPDESSGEIEEHNLETKPSMNQVNDGSEDIVISTSEPSTEISGRSISEHPIEGLEEPVIQPFRTRPRGDLAPQAFDATFRDGTMFERSLPSASFNNSTIGNLTIAQRDTTFSSSMYHIAELLSGKDTETLEQVDLSNAQIEAIKGLGEMIPRTRDINLSHNSIRVLEGLPTLAVNVNLSYNLLNRLSCFPIANITTLDISHNGLTDLRGLKELRSLVDLNVSHNSLSSVTGLDSLQGLLRLNISHNKLSGAVIPLPRLRVLYAGANPLKNIRLETPLLEELNVDGASLTTIDAVPSVKTLSIRNNRAAVDFKGWESLETLYYDGNDVARNCGEIAPRTVWWQGNNLTGFDANMLRTAYEVVLAGLGIEFSTFVGTYPAQELTLCNMGLRKLPAWLPRRFPFVRTLNLAFNELDDASLAVLSQFDNLEELSLFHNGFCDASHIGETLKGLPRLAVLDLRANPVTDFYPEVIFDDHKPPMAAYDEVLDLDWNTMAREAVKTARYAKYKRALGLHLQWLDGTELEVYEQRKTSPPAHTEPSTSLESTAPSTPSRADSSVESRFMSAKSRGGGTYNAAPNMTALGHSTPPRTGDTHEVIRRLASDLIALYDAARRTQPHLWARNAAGRQK